MPEHRNRIRDRAIGALTAVVALALVLGGVLAAGAYAAARMVGLTDGGGQQAAAHAVAHPSPSASATSPASKAPEAAASPSATHPQEGAAGQSGQQARPPREHPHAHHQQQARPNHQQHHRRHRHHQPATGTVTLHTTKTRVRPMGRVNLSGRCGCRSGTTLVVQRLEHGRWSRFPATATASHGRFYTWVMTGRRGANEFRVVAPGGRPSNPVTITVG